MLYFKACPRCQGDMYTDKDQFGPFVACLQCGYHCDPPVAPGPAPQQATQQEAAYVYTA